MSVERHILGAIQVFGKRCFIYRVYTEGFRKAFRILKRKHADVSPVRALSLLAMLQSADIVLPTTDGREIRLRRITQPNSEQKLLLDQLEITLARSVSVLIPKVVQTRRPRDRFQKT